MSTIIAVLRAIPGVITLLTGLKELWDKWEVSQIKKHYEAKKRVRHKLMEQLAKAKTDEEKENILELIALLNSTDSIDKL